MVTLHGHQINVGDTVWRIDGVKGECIDARDSSDWPIWVEFDDAIETYLKDGRTINCEPVTLFWQPFKIPQSAYEKPQQ